MEEKPLIKPIEEEIRSITKNPIFKVSPEELKALQGKADKVIANIDSLLNEQNEGLKLNDKARLHYLKGKVSDYFPVFSKKAQESLEKSVKLNPKDADPWNTLGHVLWKKNDFVGSKKCFEQSIEHCGKNKIALRSLSMIMRCIPENRPANVAQSVEYAKQALTLDIKDGESWYVLGNAYFTNFFANQKKMDELKLALKAYNQAEFNNLKENPDLYYNRASIHKYLEDYAEAISNYQTAVKLDATLDSVDQINKIYRYVDEVDVMIANKGKIKEKNLGTMIKSVPCVLRSQPQHLGKTHYDVRPVNSLAQGLNKGVILSMKVAKVISSKGDVPTAFIALDFQGEFFCLSIYNASDDIYDKVNKHTEVYVVDPYYKPIEVTQGDKTIRYRCVQVFEIETLYIDSAKVLDIYSPNTIVNQTFEKPGQDSPAPSPQVNK